MEEDKGSIHATAFDEDGQFRTCIALRMLRDYGHSVEWDESSSTVFVHYKGSRDRVISPQAIEMVADFEMLLLF